MESMIERCARRLAAQHYADRFRLPEDAPLVMTNVDGNWYLFVNQVMTVIEATREPTREMLKPIAFGEWPADKEIGLAMQRKLGLAVIPPNSEMEQAAGQWSRAIDAALKEQE